jgi:hypothetical protein
MHKPYFYKNASSNMGWVAMQRQKLDNDCLVEYDEEKRALTIILDVVIEKLGDKIDKVLLLHRTSWKGINNDIPRRQEREKSRP